jgi:hypothetical protein
MNRSSPDSRSVELASYDDHRLEEAERFALKSWEIPFAS